jgi:alkylation response protein AidB-like acyl-CoA dehydrogenase
MHEATRFIHDHGDELRQEYRPSEELGKLTDRAVEILKESGGLRLLLAKDLGGYEAHPVDFFEWVIAVGTYHPAAGWIASVCGVHPYEFSMMNPKVREEVYGTDPNTLVASPYAPLGRARPVEGGYLLSGRWPYSTGTDHSDWVVLGGMVTEDRNEVPHHGTPDVLHFVLPKGRDYEIVEGSWNVMGLVGTGSKDVMMTDTFVPEYRTVREDEMTENVNAEQYRPDSPLYHMRFFTLFTATIIAGTYGVASGLLRELREYFGTRVNVIGQSAATDPFILAALARAEADLDASIRHLLWNVGELYDWVAAGNAVTVQQRIDFRRNQVAGSARSVTAVNELYRLAGSQAVQKRHLLEGFYRDLQVAQAHFGNAANPVLVGWGLHAFGHDVPSTVFF